MGAADAFKRILLDFGLTLLVQFLMIGLLPGFNPFNLAIGIFMAILYALAFSAWSYQSKGKTHILRRDVILADEKAYEIPVARGTRVRIRITSTQPVSLEIHDQWHYRRGDMSAPIDEDEDVTTYNETLEADTNETWLLVLENDYDEEAEVHIRVWH